MSLNPDQILAMLSEVIDPYTQKKLAVTAKNCEIGLEGGEASITVPLGYPLHNGQADLRKRIETALGAQGVNVRALRFTSQIATHAVQPGLKPMPNIRNIIAVASGKGGVGKSTTAVNVALALASQGARVGLLDADIYGPSVPIMLGLSGKPKSLDGKTMEPLMGHGLQANSIGFLIEEDSPAIWRGPMVTQALTQLLTQTNWNDLDYLIVDMPPGTGDIALTMAQKVPLTGAIIVTTPQDLALADARRGLRMFQKVNVPVLGIVENMSVHICSNCGHAEPIFGENGGRNMAAEFNLPWLGALPLQLSIRTQTDSGTPSVVAEPDGEPARAYHAIAAALAANVAALPRDMAAKMPGVVARKS
ncbi:iron-sulfur cluster carrier protein ApbC [Pollutimonas bauzanensis]|uniref:Iron-sulfur cluster carrier protein n=1 Tax=Pollutimonas bauzanensis TaxID=658167 RepID=A0A1M5PX73_9BURK|nr:iron-sulfur cluster carrier protein ApbC [Pollutimonas bauzanensis]SHH06627.1 ATP-binding protein involved in chromosome partitioning [Pollutimonas bauzanensis]